MAKNKYIKENVSVVRDGFSKYLDVSTETPVIITNHDEPKSVLISYADFLEKWGVKKPSTKSKSCKQKYTNFEDFIGMANPNKKKIDINKEIDEAWKPNI